MKGENSEMGVMKVVGEEEGKKRGEGEHSKCSSNVRCDMYAITAITYSVNIHKSLLGWLLGNRCGW